MYFLAQNNAKTGPFTLDQLREMWRAGAVYPQTLYWEDGMAEWQPLSRLDASLLNFGLSTPTAYPVSPPVDPLAPAATSHEPSAYDLPAGHLPAAPPATTAPAPAAAIPSSNVAPGGPHSLIAPTNLPPGGLVAPLPPAAPEVPPAAYLSLTFGLLGPILMLFGHGIGAIPGVALCIAAVVCGHTARAAIVHSANRLPGMGFAVAGLCFGYGCLALVVLMVVLFLGLGLLVLFGLSAAQFHGGH